MSGNMKRDGRMGSLVGQHCASQIGLPPIFRPTTQSWRKKARKTISASINSYLIHPHLSKGWLVLKIEEFYNH